MLLADYTGLPDLSLQNRCIRVRRTVGRPVPWPPPAPISRCCRGRRPRHPAEGASPLPACPSYVGAGHARPAAFPQALSCRTRPGRTCEAPTPLPAGLSVCAPAQTPPYFFSLSKNAVGAGLCSARGRLPCEKLSRKSVAASGRRAEQSPAPTNPQQRRYSYPGVRYFFDSLGDAYMRPMGVAAAPRYPAPRTSAATAPMIRQPSSPGRGSRLLPPTSKLQQANQYPA